MFHTVELLFFSSLALSRVPRFILGSVSSLSSERSGRSVSGQRTAARSPVSSTDPGRSAQRRGRQQSVRGGGPSAQTRALRRCRRRRKSPSASARGPAPSSPRLHHHAGARSSPRSSAELRPPTGAAGSRGSGAHQTSLGHRPAAELSLAGGERAALRPHHQLCHLAAQPQRAQPVTTATDWSKPTSGGNRVFTSCYFGVLTLGWLLLSA